jgi:hypothetical protein
VRLENFVVGGIYWPPFLADVLIAAVVFVPLRLIALRLGLYRLVWHPALFELAIFTCLLGVVMFFLGP